MRLVVEARTSLPFDAKKLVDDAVVAKKLVEVAFVVELLTAEKLPVAVALVILVLASVVRPATFKVPDEVSPVVDALARTV